MKKNIFIVQKDKISYIWGLLRIGIGWIFLWAFLDKLFGLGFTTAKDKSWLMGISPTEGFLKMGTHGPFAIIFKSLAGYAVIDWLFMIGVLLLGLALIFGIGVKIASFFGIILLSLMWLAVLPPEHNPILDEHIIYLIILIGVYKANAGRILGLGKYWSKTKLVKKYSILE